MKLFTTLFLIVICVLTYFVYIGPTYSAVGALSAQKDNYSQILQDSKNIASKQDQILATYDSISTNDLDRLNKIVPLNFNSVTFINYLNIIASKYGLVVNGMKVVDQGQTAGEIVDQSQKSYQTRNITFSVSGQYATLINFLKSLESGLYLVDVTGLSVTKGSTIKSGLMLNFNISLNTYSIN